MDGITVTVHVLLERVIALLKYLDWLGPSSFLNPVEPWFLTSNYYLVQLGLLVCKQT